METNNMTNFKKFSMIELLTVIAIILILAAMLLPVLENAREQAKRVICASNLKQLGTRALALAGDHNRTHWKDGRNHKNYWFQPDLIRKDFYDEMALPEDIFKCATTPKFWTDSIKSHGQAGVPDKRTSFYYLGNGYRSSANWERSWGLRPQTLGDDDLDDKVLWSEMVEYQKGSATYRMNHVRINSVASPVTLEGAMQVFADGHGAWKNDFPTLIWQGANSNHKGTHGGGSNWERYWW